MTQHQYNRFILARYLKVQANLLDKIAWNIEMIGAKTGDPELVAHANRNRKIAKRLRAKSEALRPDWKRNDKRNHIRRP